MPVMYREIRADDAGIQEVVITTPLDDYELLDFGYGRQLPLKVSDIYRRLTT